MNITILVNWFIFSMISDIKYISKPEKLVVTPEAYSEPCETFNSTEIVTIYSRHLFPQWDQLRCSKGSEYAFAHLTENNWMVKSK